MKVEDILKIGLRVELEITNKDESIDFYMSKIEDVNNNKMSIWLPMVKGVTLPIHPKQKIRINSVQEDGVYYFEAEVIKRNFKPYAHFIVHYPKKLKRVQRRNYVRIRYNIPVLFEIDELESKGVSINLSGGGMNLITVKKLKIGDILKLRFSLSNGISFKNIISTVKRISILEEEYRIRYKYGLEFIEIDEKQRDHIISYLFELQRNRRSKGKI